ncbi:MAG TPA: hypothetical protein VK941_10695 [Gillisia sp.]|nr:hypothetical protein [Gillisia sp.]
MRVSPILLLVLCPAIMNCSSPAVELSYPDPEYFEVILGKWHPSETISKGISYPYGGHEECGRDFLEFSREGIMKSVNILECREIIDNSGLFNVVGYFLSIQYGENVEVQFEIAKLDASSMELIFIDHLDGDGIGKERRVFLRE